MIEASGPDGKSGPVLKKRRLGAALVFEEKGIFMKKKITTWEAACIITGYGIGGGVLAMPYLAEKNGIIMSMIILAAAFAASILLHMMIADVVLKCGAGTQVVGVFSRFMFKGKLKKLLTVVFFALMAVILVANLAAYVAGAAEVIEGLIGISPFVCKLLFYIIAAAVVLFGLKAVAVSEKLMVAIIFGMIAVLGILSLLKHPGSLSVETGTARDALAYYGMAMLAFAAFFSVPQAVEGLQGDEKEVKKAVILGLGNNFIIMIVVICCALIGSETVTEVGMVGWSEGIGSAAEIIGGLFTLVAMLTTYWSISLALSDILREQFPKMSSKICWLIATLPSLIITLLNVGDFLDFLQIAGGAIAIVIALLFVPCYRIANKEIPRTMLGKCSGTAFQIFVIIAYILMGIGNII